MPFFEVNKNLPGMGWWHDVDTEDMFGSRPRRKTRVPDNEMPWRIEFLDLSDAPPQNGDCIGLWDTFFPEQGETIYTYRAAKRICDGCPVKAECGDWAIRHPGVTDGMWGGMTPPEIRRKRQERHQRKAS